jgi:hypothetical protein
MKGTPLSDLEKGLAAKVAGASFPPGTASKRFARNLEGGYIRELSDKGRMFFAYVADRFRRQYSVTPEERQWINNWLARSAEERALARVRQLDRGGLAGSPMDGHGGGGPQQSVQTAAVNADQGELP